MIKKLFILLFICTLGCTDTIVMDSDDNDNIAYAEGYITITVENQEITTRADWEYDDYFPSAKLLDPSNALARKIFNETILIFDKDLKYQKSLITRNLPTSIDNTVNTNSNLIDGVAVAGNHMTTSAQYFYGLINAPTTYFNLFNTSSTLANLTKDEFEHYALNNITIALLTGQDSGSRGYTLFSSKPPKAYNLVGVGVDFPKTPEYEYYPPSNDIHIDVEWVFARVSVAYLPSKDGSEELYGTIKDMQYRVVNNPTQIQIFHNSLDDVYRTPHYDEYEKYGASQFEEYYKKFFDPATDLSDPANVDENWFTANTWEDNTIWTARKDTFTYCMENNNKIKLEGNSTCVLLRGQYIPKVWLDAEGNESTSGSTDGTFWRIKQAGDYTSGYYKEEPHPVLVGSRGEVIEYPKGITYYPIWLQTDGDYMVKRNNYYKIAITSIMSAGEPKVTSVINPTNVLSDTKTKSRENILVSKTSKTIGWQQNN